MKDDEQVRNADLSIWWSLKIKFEKPAPHVALCLIANVCTRDHKDHHNDDAHPEGIPRKPALVYQSCERDPKAPTMTLLNQGLFYLKHDNSGQKKVHDSQLGLESYQQKVNLTTPTITFPGIERKKLLTITSKTVVGLIYENSKNDKRVMVIKDIPMFCDARLIRVLKLVEKKNMDVKHGYTDPKLSDNDTKYLRFYEEYIKDRLTHQDQMRRWEMVTTRTKKG
nr:hypothetical protein [Tanacetum cinerariifolium]